MSETQTTFIMVKPDGVKRELVDEIIRRFESIGLILVGRKDITPSLELAETHYGIHRERPFFSEVVSFITSGPVVAMAWSGIDAISVARIIIGATNGREALPGTIRGAFLIITLAVGFSIFDKSFLIKSVIISNSAEFLESSINCFQLVLKQSLP